MTPLDPLRVEEAALNAVGTDRQLLYDGWLLRLCPGKAKRARSVNPHGASTRPIGEKIERCARIYAERDLPLLFRITPFDEARRVGEALDAIGFVAIDPTLVQVAPLAAAPAVHEGAQAAIAWSGLDDWVEAVGTLRGSPPSHRESHRARLVSLPLAAHRALASVDGRIVAAGQVVVEDGLAGVYDVVTDPAWRGRGLARRLVAALLARARGGGAHHAYLQVDAGNEPALALYRGFAFATLYDYRYFTPGGDAS